MYTAQAMRATEKALKGQAIVLECRYMSSLRYIATLYEVSETHTLKDGSIEISTMYGVCINHAMSTGKPKQFVPWSYRYKRARAWYDAYTDTE